MKMVFEVFQLVVVQGGCKDCSGFERGLAFTENSRCYLGSRILHVACGIVAGSPILKRVPSCCRSQCLGLAAVFALAHAQVAVLKRGDRI